MNDRTSKLPRGSRGSSIIELLVVVTLSSSISAAAYYSFAVQTWTSNRENANAVAQNRVRNAIERMVRELQTVGFDPQDKNALFPNRFGFQETAAQRLRFTTDANRNGEIDGTVAENRGFDLSGGAMRALMNGTPTTLATGVQGLTFAYLNNAGQPTTSLTDVREVTITVTLLAQGRSPSMGPSVHTLVGTAFLRNG